MMLHQDGSRHVWLEGQPALDLIVTLDDATGGEKRRLNPLGGETLWTAWTSLRLAHTVHRRTKAEKRICDALLKPDNLIRYRHIKFDNNGALPLLQPKSRVHETMALSRCAAYSSSNRRGILNAASAPQLIETPWNGERRCRT
jgi:hypothetical protein